MSLCALSKRWRQMGTKILLDLSFPAHSDMWEEWEEGNRLIMTCKGITSVTADHVSRFFPA